MNSNSSVLFTRLWLIVVSAILLHASWELFSVGQSYRWLAPVISAGSIVSYFGYRKLVGAEAGLRATPLLHASVALAPMMSLYALWLEEPEPLLPLLYAVVVCYGGTLLYLRHIRRSAS